MALQSKQDTVEHWWLGSATEWFVLSIPGVDRKIGAHKHPWFRTVQQMPIATGEWCRDWKSNDAHSHTPLAMAGVNMRLEAGAIRELHWHQTAEVSGPCCSTVRC